MPYLIVLAAEALAIAVRQNMEVTGMTIGKEETKLLHYVGDMSATLSDINSLQALLDLLEVYKNAYGLAINCTKTEGMLDRVFKKQQNKTLGFLNSLMSLSNQSSLNPQNGLFISLIPTPEVVVTELNRNPYKFLWKGTDKEQIVNHKRL